MAAIAHDHGDTTVSAPRRPTRAEVIRDLRRGAGLVANALAVVVTAAAAILAGILVLHILFVLFKANQTNEIVRHVNSYAHDLAGPFRTLFTFHTKTKTPPVHEIVNVKLTDTVNYGIAALAFLFGGRILAALLRKLAP
jgi:cobalamin synthase